jgi:hypothetical protein
MSACICFCAQISPPSRSRAHPPPFLPQASRLCPDQNIPRGHPTRQWLEKVILRAHTGRPCMCLVSTFRYGFVRSCYKCPSRTLGALNGTHRVQPKGKRMAFYFPFYPLNAGCPRVEAQVNARVGAGRSRCVDLCIVLLYLRPQ